MSRIPVSQPLDAVHVGGGGFTFPRYVDATRPGSRNTVFELDQAVFDTARDELGLRTSRDLRVRIGDGRLLIRGRSTIPPTSWWATRSTACRFRGI